MLPSANLSSSVIQVLTDERDAGEALAGALQVPPTAITEVPTPNAAADIRLVVGPGLPPTSPLAA